MYKNKLQELAQRSCFNLPSYSCIRQGPDHAPRFKAIVNFNGEIFESPAFCTTLRQAEHSAAEVALSTLANRGPSRSLAAKVLDEIGVYKNLLQETAHRAGLNLPVYTTVRSGPGHVPVFTCTVELAGMCFAGEPSKTKKQAQKNAAMAAWSALKQLSHLGSSSSSSSTCPSLESGGNEEHEQVIVARDLASLCPPKANRSSVQNNRHPGRHRSAPFRRDTNSASSGISLYPMQCPNWAYSNLSPDVAMYQTWRQGQVTQHQSRMLTLLVAPTPPPGRQILPSIHSISRPNHTQYILPREQEPISVVPGITMPASGPSLYFPNRSMPIQIMSRSQVTTQEIQEERTQIEEWLHGDADPDGRKVNIQLNSSGFSPFEVLNAPVSVKSHAETLIQKTPQEGDQRKIGGSESYIGQYVQLAGGQSEPFNRVSQGLTDTGFKPRATSPGHVKFQLGSQRGFDTSQSNLSPRLLPKARSPGLNKYYKPISSATHVTIRTVGPVSSVSPRQENLNTQVPAPMTMRTSLPTCLARPRLMNSGEIPSVNFMAPVVQIRSVVPVCSAPLERKIPDSIKEGLFSSGERRTKEPEDVSAAISELGKLQI